MGVAEGVAVDLRGEQVLDAGARGAVEDLVGGVLVRPRRTQTGPAGHLEDRVHLEVGVRVERLAGLRVDRELRGVDQARRVAGHRQDAVRQARQALAGVDGGLVLVEVLGEVHLDPGLVALAPGGSRREKGGVVGVVVVDARGAGAAARRLGDHAGEGVGRRGGVGVGVLHTAADQLGQRGLRVPGDVPGQVRLVQPVDGDQQDMPGGGRTMGGGERGGLGGGHPGQDSGGGEDGCEPDMTSGHLVSPGCSEWAGGAGPIRGPPCVPDAAQA